MSLSGRTFVILGATGGIGAALSRRLAQAGARLVLAAREPARLHALADELGAHPLVTDATDFEQVDTLFTRALELSGSLAGAANCVGSLLLKSAHQTSAAEWQATLSANLTTAFATVRASARTMTDGGSVVLLSSAAGRLGLANHEAIAAAKAGVLGLMLSAAATYAARGLRVNAVAPGLVRTPLTARLTSSEASLKASTSLHALGRIGEPEDIASAIAWLLDPENSWVTGQVIGVDGGLSTVRSRG